MNYRLQYFLSIFIFIMSAIASAQVRDTANPCCWDKNPVKGFDLEQLGIEYRRLKKFKYSDCCQFYGSRMMVVMKLIGDSVNRTEKKRLSFDGLKALMGEPDRTELKTDPKLGDYQSLIYDWRNGHDYLQFNLIGNQLSGGFWYHAYD